MSSTNDIMNNPWVIGIGTTVISTIIIGAGVFIFKKIFGVQRELKTQIENQSAIIASKVDQSSVPKLESTKSESAGYILVKKIDNQPPYLREAAEEAYIGQIFEQEARYINIRESAKEGFMHLSLVSKEGYPWIYCEIKLDDFSWLKTLKGDTVIKIKGKITKFSGHEIRLDNVELEYN